tara:strand:+ start:580 stop:789 length:210 start_codon:yes stop_codon:yes gene_type:complete
MIFVIAVKLTTILFARRMTAPRLAKDVDLDDVRGATRLDTIVEVVRNLKVLKTALLLTTLLLDTESLRT